MTVEQAGEIARHAAARHRVELVHCGPAADSDGYEVRMRKYGTDYSTLMQWSEDKPPEHFRAEVFNLAERCAEGPT